MTEFQELVKDAPQFVSMERGELVAYAYGMYAAGAKTDAENAKLQNENARLRSCLSDDAENARMIMGENDQLRELVRDLYEMAYPEYPSAFEAAFADRMRELGVYE